MNISYRIEDYAEIHDRLRLRYEQCIYGIQLKEYMVPDGSWMKKNIKGRWYSERKKFFFDNEQDAIMFTLRWG